MGPYIIVSLTLSTSIYQEGGMDTCLNYGTLRVTAITRNISMIMQRQNYQAIWVKMEMKDEIKNKMQMHCGQRWGKYRMARRISEYYSYHVFRWLIVLFRVHVMLLYSSAISNIAEVWNGGSSMIYWLMSWTVIS